MAYPYIIQGDNITVVIDNKSHTVSKSHLTYDRVREAIIASDWDTVKSVIDPKRVVIDFGQGNVTVIGDQLLWKNRPMNTYLAGKIVSMIREGFDVTPLVAFMDNLYDNPSSRAVGELYKFLEAGNLPITQDGCFLAFKKVSANYTDVHSGSVFNGLAADWHEYSGALTEQGAERNVTVEILQGVTTVSMPRNQVDDQADNTCSHGLHFCSEGYLKSFGGRHVMILKINPADVVSIPSDYNDTKGRTARYQVIGQLATGVTPTEEFACPVYGAAPVVAPPAATVQDKAECAPSMTPNAIRKREARRLLRLKDEMYSVSDE
jgi:hypothetical protein